MAKFKNTVWDTIASAYVAWLSDDDYDPAGASYPGPGTFGVQTSQYRRGEIYDAVISSATDDTAVHVDVAGEIDGVAEKASPVSGDFVLLEDSASGNIKKKAQVGNLPGGGGAPLSDVAPVDVDPQAASAGSAGEASRQDHKHDIVTAAAGATTPGDSAAEGTADSLARSDHQHSLAAFGSGSGTFCEGDDSRLSDARTPTSHASSHNAGGGDALAIDAVAGTGSLRTLGTGAQQACAGNDARLSDNRTDADAIHDNVTGEINAIAEKASPVGADVLVIEDSAASFAKKKVTITNLPGGSDADAIHDNVAGEIALITEKATPVSGDLLILEDSEDSNNKKRVQAGNLPGGVSLSDTAPVDVDPQAASAGSAGEASRQDHKHDIVTATAGAATPGDSAAEGTANSLARSDHQHSLAAFGSTSGTFCEGDDSRLSDARTPTAHTLGGAEHSADTLADVNALISDATLDDSSDLRAANKLQTVDIDSALAPTDGQVLSYDGTGTQWTASSPAEGTSYLDIGRQTVTDAGGAPDTAEVGRVVFDASQHNTVTLKAVVNSVFATTGSVDVKLYDDGSPSTPGTPRLVSTLNHTDDTLTYEVLEQALTVVASGPTTNEILGEARVYRAVIEITATSSDTATVNTVGFAAVGNGDVVTISADMVQAIAMSLNA